jgi:hypothetical protein
MVTVLVEYCSHDERKRLADAHVELSGWPGEAGTR